MEYWDRNRMQNLVPKKIIEEVFEEFKSSAIRLGFNRCSILVFPTDASTSSPLLSINNWPDRWNEHFEHRYGYRNNPLIEYCHHSLLPVIWTQPLFDSILGFWGDLCCFGLAHGVSQSVHDHRGYISIFSFVQDNSAINPSQLYEQIGVMLWLINRTHMSLIDQLPVTAHPIQITQRELDVLKWTAEGKTSHEVARILSISERTVNFHVQSIINKLNVKNKTAAVIAAVKRRLI